MGKFSIYKLPLKSLTAGEHSFDFHLGKQFFVDMENTDVRDANVDVKATVTVKNDVYLLSLKAVGEVIVLCDRCLDEMPLAIDAGYDVMVKYGDDYRDDSDEMIEIPWGDNDLNVAYMIYDTVMLAIPIKHVHPMGKCNRAMSAVLKRHRARPADGEEFEQDLIDTIDEMTPADAPVDPRWDALKGLGSDE